MSADGKIDLREALQDTPQVQQAVAALEKQCGPCKEYTTLLRDTFQACHLHQEKVCDGIDTLSKLLNTFDAEGVGEKDGFLSNSFFRIGRYLNELHSCQEMLSTQLHNAVIELLSKFLSEDFSKLEKLKEAYDVAWQEHEQAMVKYSRVSKKKDSDKTRFEANADLYSARRKFCQSSNEYFSELNCFQHRKRFALLEPLLTFMHAQMAYFKVGHEILNKELGKVLSELSTDIQRANSQYELEVRLMAEERREIELQFPSLCLPDPDPTDPFSDYQPPSTTLTSKSGYLFLRTTSGFPFRWDRSYVYTKKGYLYSLLPQKAPESLVQLKGAEAVGADIDDRRYVLQISHQSLKRPIYLLAESEVARDEWIATINNAGSGSNTIQPRSVTSKDPDVVRLERERIRTWVNKEIHEPAKKEKTSSSSSSSKQPKLSSGQLSANGLELSSSSLKKSPVTQRKVSKQKKSNTDQQQLLTASPTTQQPQQDGSTNPARTSLSASSSLVVSALPPTAEFTEEIPKGPSSFIASLASAATSAFVPTTTAANSAPPRPVAVVLPAQPKTSFSGNFSVKYLGHMEVQDSKNTAMITETIRKVVSARRMKSVRDSNLIEMTITHKSISFTDPSAGKTFGQILLKDVLRCSVTHQSDKLFGIVNRTHSDPDKPKLLCHVLEADKSGASITAAINEAIKAAVRMMRASGSKRPVSPQPPANMAAASTASQQQQQQQQRGGGGGGGGGGLFQDRSSGGPSKVPSKQQSASALGTVQGSYGSTETTDSGYISMSSLSASAPPPQKKSSSETNLSTLPGAPATSPSAPATHKRQASASSSSSSTDFLNMGGFVTGDISGTFHQSSSDPNLLDASIDSSLSSGGGGGYVTTDQFGAVPFAMTTSTAVPPPSQPLINLQSPTFSATDQFSGYVQAPVAPVTAMASAPPLMEANTSHVTESLPTVPEVKSTDSLLSGYVQLPESGAGVATSNTAQLPQQQQQQQTIASQPPSQFPQAASSSGYFAMPGALDLASGSDRPSLSATSTPSDEQEDFMLLPPLPSESSTSTVAAAGAASVPTPAVTKPEGGGGGGGAGYGGSIVALAGNSGTMYSSTTPSGREPK